MSDERRATPLKQKITFGKFANVDLRIAEVVSAPRAEGTRLPSRVLTLDLGHLGQITSVGQFALLEEEELVGLKVVVAANLGVREMGPYVSEALTMGVLHPDSPADQGQALPLTVDSRATPGEPVF